MAEDFDWSEHADLLPDVIARQQLGPFDQTPLERLPNWFTLDAFLATYNDVLSVELQAFEQRLAPRQVRKRLESVRKLHHVGRPSMNSIIDKAFLDASEIHNIDSLWNPDSAIEEEIFGFIFKVEADSPALPPAQSGRIRSLGNWALDALRHAGEYWAGR